MEPVRTALLSFGMSGKVFHAPFLLQLPEFEWISVWERSRPSASKLYPFVHSCSTIEEVISDPSVELVIVNTPNYTHYEYAKKALMAGKHVVVEKPFTTSVEEGEELMDLSHKKRVVLSVYQNRRYDSDFRTVKKVVDEKLLGRIVEAEFHFDRFREALSPKTHKETPGPGAGALHDLGSHIIDQALLLFGRPDQLFADIRVVREGSQVNDYFEILLYYPDKRVRLHCSYLVREPLPAYIIHGNLGSFIKAKTDVQENDLQAGKVPGHADWGREPASERGLLHTTSGGREIRELITSQQGNYGDYYKGIYDAIRKGTPPPVKAGEALDVIRVISAAFDSSEAQKLVSIPGF